MSWVYRRPHTGWFYGRDRVVPLGAPTVTRVVVPAGSFMFSAPTTVVSTEQPTGVQIPHVLPYLVPHGAGVYRSSFRTAYRVIIVHAHTAAAISDVVINLPAAPITFAGLVANLGPTTITVPLGGFVMVGHIIAKPTPSLGVVVARPGERTVALFQKQRTVKITLPGDNTVRGALE